MVVEPNRQWTVEEYLAHERESEVRHELVDGEIFAMVGGSREHDVVCWNLVEILGPRLRERGCRGFTSNMRVHVPATGLFTYPDLSVVCGEPEFRDEEVDTLCNPVLLVEVLSPSTENYDRGRKFVHYRSIPSLRLYLLLAQDRPRAELFTRQPDNGWLLTETTDPRGVVELSVLDAKLPLAEVYAGVVPSA